jgi:MFS family permease
MSYKAKAHRYYRSTLFQAILIGVLSFAQPRIWSAIADLVAGGLQTVGTANTASSILFGIMFVFSPIFGILTNRIGVKPVITIGTIGFVFWSAGLYKNSLDGSQAHILADASLNFIHRPWALAAYL